MAAVSNNPKRADAHIPFCKDQGMPYLAGAAKAGVTIQRGQIAMPADGILLFSVLGFSKMQPGAVYSVMIHNHTGAVQGTVANNARLPEQLTVVGPTAADILDVVVIGQLDGQLV
jgi:hypothetical protein